MTYESKFWIDSWLLFREPFLDSFSVKENWGDITDVVFEDWKAICNPTTSIINYWKIRNATVTKLTLKVKAKSNSWDWLKGLAWWFNLSTSNWIAIETQNWWWWLLFFAWDSGNRWGSVDFDTTKTFVTVLVYDGTETVSQDRLKAYINWELQTLNFSSTAIPSSIELSSDFVVSSFGELVRPRDWDIDIVETYDYARTAEQTSNDYNNSTYKDISNEWLVLNIDSRQGAIYDKMWTEIENNNDDVLIKRDSAYWAQYFQWITTSKLITELSIDYANKDYTLVAWCKPQWTKGGIFNQLAATSRRLLYVTSQLWTILDWDTLNAWSVVLNKRQLLAITTTTAGVRKLWIDGVMVWEDSIIYNETPVDTMEIGSNVNTPFKWPMAMQRVYERAISAEEMTQLYTLMKSNV